MDITEILEENGIEYRKSNNPSEILIKCTSGLHDDNTPSLQYNLDKNIFHCWSCDFKGGSRKFLQSLGIKVKVDIESKQPYKIQKLQNMLRDIKDQRNLTIPDDAVAAVGKMSGISSEVITSFDAFFTQRGDLEDYLCFPVYQYGELRFIEGKIKYKNSPKSKYRRYPYGASTKDILFPLDRVKDRSHLVLVEGLFDMLNMWQLGYTNVVCIFGVNNFGKKKVDLLDSINCVEVTIMFDGDLAGRSASDRARDLLESRNIKTNVIYLPEGKDPGILTKEEADKYLYQVLAKKS